MKTMRKTIGRNKTNEKLILFPAFFLGEMTAEQRGFFSNQYLKPSEFHALFKQRVLILAQEGGYFSKDDIGNWSDFFKNPASLDSLLGMEGNDVNNVRVYSADGNGTYKLETALAIGYELLKSSNVAEVVVYDQNGNIVPFYLDSNLQQCVLVISP